MLISSRPWLVFEEVFDKSPRLQVHELTRDDILHFTTANVLNHPRTLILQRQDPSMITTLISEIADASSGVFLWVSLVVRSLLQGLRNHDTAEDLRTRLHELPTELHDFFYHMWTQVPQRYKAQASRLLQLVEAGTTNGRKISLLGLNFAQESDEYAREMKVEPLLDEEVGARIETTRTHLLTRSVGLVEVLTDRNLSPTSKQFMAGDLYYTSSTEASKGYPHAAFVHKTVYEFLSVPDIRRELNQATTSSPRVNTAPFSPLGCLLRSTVVKIKTFQPVATSGRVSSESGLTVGIKALVYLFLALARETEQTTGLGQTWLLEELDHTMSFHQRASTRPGVSWLDYMYFGTDPGRYILTEILPIKDLVEPAISQDLFNTFKDMVAHNPLTWPRLSSRKRPLLLHALFPPYLDFRPWSSGVSERLPKFEMVDLILQTCPEPKDSVEVSTHRRVEEVCLWNIYADTVLIDPRVDDDTYYRPEPRDVETFLRIFKLFLKYHTDYKSTTADLASMRSWFVGFLKSPHTQADAGLSRFNQEVGEAIGLIDELEHTWAKQRSDAKHRTPNGSSRADRFKRWFHQRRLRVSARPKSDSKPHI